jgi:hypothetical protein
MIIIRSPLEEEKEYDHFLYLSRIEVLYIEDRGHFVYGKCANVSRARAECGLDCDQHEEKICTFNWKEMACLN